MKDKNGKCYQSGGECDFTEQNEICQRCKEYDEMLEILKEAQQFILETTVPATKQMMDENAIEGGLCDRINKAIQKAERQEIKLTKEQKIKVIEMAIELMPTDIEAGMCWAIDEALIELHGLDLWCEEIKDIFGLQKYDEKHSPPFYFSLNKEGNRKRVGVLNEILTDLKEG